MILILNHQSTRTTNIHQSNKASTHTPIIPEQIIQRQPYVLMHDHNKQGSFLQNKKNQFLALFPDILYLSTTRMGAVILVTKLQQQSISYFIVRSNGNKKSTF